MLLRQDNQKITSNEKQNKQDVSDEIRFKQTKI